MLGARRVALTHIHQVEVVVGVESVNVVGIAAEQAVEFRLGGREVLHLVLEDYPHVVEPFLDDVVGRLAFGVGLGNLLEIIFREIGVVFLFGVGLFLLVGFGLLGLFGVFSFGVGVVAAEVVEVKRCLVATAPVVLQLAVTPFALELGTSGVFCGGVVEVPRIVAVVHREGLRRGIALQPLAHGVAVGEEFLACGRVGLLFLFFLEFLDYLVDHGALLFGRHGR